ncbi:uncharacterized protein LOC143185197 [Calliopsis andreniformis]|uniref:uncharacterized protein LOC143185197 n=1 Tax=Calliopsis andreniformis TaxID=337506 RepID=UPI003FCEA903
MSFMLETRQTNEINNKGREHFHFFKMKEDYSFKYIPESHFKHVVKNVQRQRRKEDEERIWASFVKEQELNSLRFNEKDVHLSIQSVKGFIHENMQDVDRELKRLEEDALPERKKGIHTHKPYVKNEEPCAEEKNTRNTSPKEKLLTKSKNTYGTSTLVQLSQEDNVPDRKDLEGPKSDCRLKPKKSLSDPSITQKKRYTNQLLHATNDFENNSDSDSSDSRHDIVRVQSDPVTTQKVLSMQKKIIELLNEISFRLCRIPLPDGDTDLRRRQQQTMEFTIRFSRNYLYDLHRLLASIQRHVGVVSSETELKHNKNIAFHQDMIKQKLVNAHQLLIQALNAYCKHIPNSVLEGHSTKLQDIIQIVSDLRDICNKVEISSNYFCSGDASVLPMEKDLDDKFDCILSQLKSSSECKHQPIKYKNVESTMTLASTSSHNKKPLNKKNLSSRLSMYNVDVPKNNQRKKIDFKRKGYSYSKEKKSNIINTNICNQHYSIPELLYPSPVTRTSSSRDIVQIDSVKSMNCSKEDDIKTMMDRLPIDSENEKSSIEDWKLKSKEDERANIKVEHYTNDDNLIKKVKTITKEHLSSLVPVISDLMTIMSKTQAEKKTQPLAETSMETLVEFLQKYQSPKDSDTKANSTDSCEYSRINLNGLSEIQKRGENVQLICMSSMDKDSMSEQCDASCQADYQTSIGSRNIVDSKATNSIELTISKKTERQFVAYKHEYKKLCQSKPMYSSNTQNKPWDIVAWISDKLIEELIFEITEELQMNDVIKKLFKMEFQEF